jgi:hypothetical protein
VAETGLMQTQKEAAQYGLATEAYTLLESVKRGEVPMTQALATLNDAIATRKAQVRQEEAASDLQLAEAVARVRRGTGSDALTAEVDIVDPSTGKAMGKEKLTQAELKARMESAKDAKDAPTVQKLVREYAQHAANRKEGDDRFGIANVRSRGSRMAAIEADLKALGYDTDGRKLVSRGQAEAEDDDPLGLYK